MALSDLIDKIKTEAAIEVEKIQNEAKKELEKINKNHSAKFDDLKEKRLKEEQVKQEQVLKEYKATAEGDAKNEILGQKIKYVDEIFKTLEQNLNQLTDENLQKFAKKLAAKIPQDINTGTMFVDPKNSSTYKTVLSELGKNSIKLEEKNISDNGFILHSEIIDWDSRVGNYVKTIKQKKLLEINSLMFE